MKRALLVQKLCELILAERHAHPLRIAFDGVDAAGKTTLANEVGRHLTNCGRQIIRASVDAFITPKPLGIAIYRHAAILSIHLTTRC
jgi:pantothenate kinase-related protein Tda10